MEDHNLVSHVRALQLSTEGLLRLLGGAETGAQSGAEIDRERFIEIFKGLTTPAEFRLFEHSFDALNSQVKQVTRDLAAAREIAGLVAQRAAV